MYVTCEVIEGGAWGCWVQGGCGERGCLHQAARRPLHTLTVRGGRLRGGCGRRIHLQTTCRTTNHTPPALLQSHLAPSTLFPPLSPRCNSLLLSVSNWAAQTPTRVTTTAPHYSTLAHCHFSLMIQYCTCNSQVCHQTTYSKVSLTQISDNWMSLHSWTEYSTVKVFKSGEIIRYRYLVLRQHLFNQEDFRFSSFSK